MLQSLSRMPAEMSSESRRKLLNAVTDLFLLDADPSEESREHYGDIALRSLPHLDAESRREYADSVAETATLPHPVAMSLANDTNSEVARLVLRLSPVLTDTDLAAIAISQTQEHLAAIAERARLSEGVTDILVERGDSTVLRSVSGNEGAQFSDHGFDRLLQRGGDDAAVGDALARRSDLSPQRAERVLRIVEQMSDPAAEASSHQATMMARQARQQRREVRLLIADLQAGARSLDEVVTMLAEEDRAFHLAQVIATRADVSNEQALRVLMQRDVSGIAVLARTLELGKDTFHAVLLLRGRRLYFKAKDIEDDLKAYEQLDMATAERTMRFLRLKTKLG
ncbi:MULTISPECIES: DUF2336 domain-containing protein [unclassified Bosea (in: a-proteobacteria)]|uniref:DUF2336 domain-containing protein n=1 Tax=unclassified Bosea (in: a-proteobacteria) TaxID=2653178 RepID=UPI000F7D97AF|nr:MULTISPECIES: DUF2336 domain-containing protein [unclassified Bosea (in: a-proteobacteria)]RXT19286.1 hypothetical protein B5U98_21715 [Bosea sp. Tri-39]RXT41558.1 hypothetical protein B5U99_01765 [Bosea sp. Tri-54]